MSVMLDQVGRIASILPLAAVLFACSSGASAEAPKSLEDLPEGQYPIEGLAGVRIISTPVDVKCGENASIAVGVRFTRAARRVLYVRVQRVSVTGKVLDAGPKFRNSSRWQFATLRMPGCGRLYEVRHVFYRKGDRSGQKLGDYVCVRGPNGEDCPRPIEGE